MTHARPDDGAVSDAERQGIVDQQDAALEAMGRATPARGIGMVSTLLAGYGLARVGVGVALAVAPTAASRRWVGPPAGDPTVRLTVRLLGVRDLLLGAATLAAARQQRNPAGWALAGATADAADLVVTVANRSRLPSSARAITAMAAASTATALALALGATRFRGHAPGSRGP